MAGLWVSWTFLCMVPQDSGTYAEALKKHLDEVPGYFTGAQIEDISKSVLSRLSNVKDPAYREKLASDAKQYVLSRATADAVVAANPFDPDGPRVDVFRTQAAMDLFKHELNFRLERAIAQPKSPEVVEASVRQIDLLSATLSGRLADLFEGPGASGYISSSAGRFKQYMGYLARSDLEFPFRSALTEEELKNLQIRIASYAPPKTEIPQQANPSSKGKIWVEDASKPTFHMTKTTDFGAFAAVESELARIYTPAELFDERYQALRRKMVSEFEELRKVVLKGDKVVLGDDSDTDWYAPKKGMPALPAGTSASDSRAPLRPPAVPPADDPRGTGRFGWLLLPVLLALAGLGGWIVRRSCCRRAGP